MSGRHHDPQGFAIPLVIMFLVALTILAGTATLLTVTELRISGLYGAAGRAREVATVALEEAIDSYAAHGADPGIWPLRGELEGFDYSVAVVRDSFDFGGGLAPVSIDADGRRNGDGLGEPVHVLVATASRATIRSTRRVWVAPHVVPRIPAAVVLNRRGTTRWRGGGELSGVNHAPNGQPLDPSAADATGACDENRPALHSTREDAAAPSFQMTVAGNPAHASTAPPYTTHGAGPQWPGLDEVLGVSSGAIAGAQTGGLQHHLRRRGTLDGVTWITDRAGGPLSCLTQGGCGRIQGDGILIVHNPRYDPREHDPQDPSYDPLKALSPLHQPARLEDISGGTFRGLVIVDRLPDRTSGPFAIIGGLVELSSGSSYRVLDWHSGAEVRYSCRALVDAFRAVGLGPARLGWLGR